jgi:hypothetical protein
MLTLFDFPAEHGPRLRTASPIESAFSVAKAQTKKTKGAGSRKGGLATAFKLLLPVEQHWAVVRAICTGSRGRSGQAPVLNWGSSPSLAQPSVSEYNTGGQDQAIRTIVVPGSEALEALRPAEATQYRPRGCQYILPKPADRREAAAPRGNACRPMTQNECAGP